MEQPLNTKTTKRKVKNRYLIDGESIDGDRGWSMEVLLDHQTLSGVISLNRTGSKVRVERVRNNEEGTLQGDPADPQNILTETKVYSYERIRLANS